MFQIKRDELIAGLDILAMVPEKLGVPSSEYYYVRGKGNRITVSVASYISGEVELKGEGEWPIKGDFFIDRRTFVPFVLSAREVKDKHRFQFEGKKKQLKVSHGARKALFDTQDNITGYGNLQKILKHKKTTLPLTDDLKHLLICGKNCAVPDAVVPHLNCVYVTKGAGFGVELYADSGKVFYVGKGNSGKDKVGTSIPFPLYLIGLLDTKGLKNVSWIGKYVVLKFSKGLIWQPISEEALTGFPVSKIKRHAKLANSLSITFTTSSRRFSKLMLRLGYYLQSVRRKDWVVNVTGKKNSSKLLITTGTPGVMFEEKLSTSELIKKDFKLQWPLDILDPVFEFLSQKTKKVGVVVRLDKKHGVSYIQAGSYWLAVTSKQEE